MSDKNNIYNILNKFDSLTPSQEELIEEKATIQKSKTLLESKMEEVLSEKLSDFKKLADPVKKFAKLLDPDAQVKAKNMTPDQIKALQQAKKDPKMLDQYRNYMEGDMSNHLSVTDPEEYERRVEAVMDEYGVDHSDAEGIVDAQLRKEGGHDISESTNKLGSIIRANQRSVDAFLQNGEMSEKLLRDLHYYYSVETNQIPASTDDEETISELFYRDIQEQGLSETKGALVNEDDSEDSPVGNAITRRIIISHSDLLSTYGLDAVINAINDVAEDVGDVEEIGSSDVSGWVKDVSNILKGATKIGVEEAQGGMSKIDQIRDIVDNQQAKKLKFDDGSTLVDGFTASAIIQVYDAVNDANKAKIEEKLKTIAGVKKIASIAFSLVKESTGVTDYNPKSQGGTRKELLAKLKKTKDSKDATAARKAGATQKELKDAMSESKKTKNPYAIGMAQAMKSTGDKPPLKKSTIKKAHEIAKKVDEGRRFRELPPDDPESFANYILEFYGPNGIYPMGATRDQVLKAIEIYLSQPETDMAYDSVDRENVRDILIKKFGLKFPDAPRRLEESTTINRMINKSYSDLFFETDTGEADARKTTPSSKEENDKVFARFKKRSDDERKSYEQDLKDRGSDVDDKEKEISTDNDNLEENVMNNELSEMMRLAGVKTTESRIDVDTIQSAQKHSAENPSKKDSESDKNIDKPYGYRDGSGKSDDEKDLDEGSMDLNLLKAAQKHSEENPSKKDAESDRNIDKPYGYRDSQSKDDKELDEAEMEEGNEFTGALAKAKASGADEFEVDGKTYKVKEDVESDEEKDDDDEDGEDDDLKEMMRLAGMKLDECGDMGASMMSPVGSSTEQQGRMNVSTNMSSDGTKSVTVTADGDAAVSLMQILTLAGMKDQDSQVYSDETQQMEKVEEVMGNAPDPEVMPVQVLTKGGDGEVAGKEKKMSDNGSARFSDNPLRESDVKLDIAGTEGKSDEERHAAIMKKYPNAKKVGKTPGGYSTTGKGKADLVSGIRGVRKITTESDSMFSGRFLKEYESIKAKTK